MPQPPAVAPTWSFTLAQPTGENIGSLQAATSRSLSFALDGAATAAFTMPGNHPETAQVVDLATDLRASRNGVPLFWGRVGGSTDTLSADVITSAFTAIDYRGMLARRLLWSGVTRSWRGVDQADIAWQMIADTQGLPGGNLGITRGSAAATGTVRDRDYDAGKNLGEALDQLGETQGGYEWEIDALRRFNLYYPTRGRNPGAVLAYGRDIVEMQRSLTQSSFANAVRFNGSATTAADELTVTTWDPELGRWDAQASDPNLVLQDTVDQRAAYELASSSTLSPAFNVTLAEGAWDPTLIGVGDTVQLIVQAGRLNVNTFRRVIQIDIALSDDGAEKVVLSVAAAPPALSSRLAAYNTRINNLERSVGYIPDVPVGGMYDWPGSSPPTLTMWCDGTSLATTDYPDLYAIIGTTFGTIGAGSFRLPDCRGRATIASGTGGGLTARSTGQYGGSESVILDQTTTGTHAHAVGTATGAGGSTHFHTVVAPTGPIGADHTHPFTANTGTEGSGHGHKYGGGLGQAQGSPSGTWVPIDDRYGAATSTTGDITATHIHAVTGTTGNESAGHTHQINASSGNANTDHTHAIPNNTQNQGGSAPHENMPPWIAIGKVIKVLNPQNQ